MPTPAEWSVTAMYSRPEARAASTICSSDALPSDASVCVCRSPRMSLASTSTGNVPARARASSTVPSRISGGTGS